MAYIPGKTLQYHMNRLAGTLNAFDVPTLDAQGAANLWAGSSGLAIVGALNKKAGTSGLELQGVLNFLAGTSGLGENEASARIESWTAIPTRADLSVWYDGSAVNGLGVNNPADAAVITTWKDLSGNGRDLTQGTNSLRPVFAQSAAVVNSQPSVWFNNNTDTMSTVSNVPMIAQKSIYAVVHRISSGVVSPQSIYAQRNPSASAYGPQLRLTGVGASSATTVDYRVATNPDLSTVTSSTTVANGSTNVLSMVADGSGSTVTSIKGFINGTLRGSTTGSGDLTATSNIITVGAVTILAALHHCVYGYYATILAYDTAHTDTQRLAIERWLGSRYGITVA